MALSLVNFSGGGQTGGAFASATTASQNVASGNSLVVGCRWPVASITDTAGNNYIRLPFTPWNNGNLGDGLAWFFCNNCVGKSNLQITATFVGTGSGLDTYTVIGAWQFTGGFLVFDQMAVGQSSSSGTTQSDTVNPHYQQSVFCGISFVNNLSTFGVNSPLVQDGGTSIAGNQIGGAEHAIFNTGFASQTLSTTSSSSAAWFIGGPIFRIMGPGIDPNTRRRIVEAALFTGREYNYYITLERLF